MSRTLGLLLALALTGCADIDWTRGLYEGIRAQRQTSGDPRDATPLSPMPDYDSYRRECEALEIEPR